MIYVTFLSALFLEYNRDEDASSNLCQELADELD
jgi:hypothetical protein